MDDSCKEEGGGGIQKMGSCRSSMPLDVISKTADPSFSSSHPSLPSKSNSQDLPGASTFKQCNSGKNFGDKSCLKGSGLNDDYFAALDAVKPAGNYNEHCGGTSVASDVPYAERSPRNVDTDAPIFPAEEPEILPSFPGDDVGLCNQTQACPYTSPPVFPSNCAWSTIAYPPCSWLQSQRSSGDFQRHHQQNSAADSPAAASLHPSCPSPPASHPSSSASTVPHVPSPPPPPPPQNSRHFNVPSLCSSLTVETCPETQVYKICEKHPRTIFYMYHTPQMSCGIEHVEPLSEVPWHLHLQSSEMLYCTEGTGKVCVTEGDIERELAFHPGVMLCVPPLIPHRIVNENSTSMLKFVWNLSPPQSYDQVKAERNRLDDKSAYGFEDLKQARNYVSALSSNELQKTRSEETFPQKAVGEIIEDPHSCGAGPTKKRSLKIGNQEKGEGREGFVSDCKRECEDKGN